MAINGYGKPAIIIDDAGDLSLNATGLYGILSHRAFPLKLALILLNIFLLKLPNATETRM